MLIPINLVFEDDLSEFVMTRLLDSFGQKYHIGNTYNGQGFGYIKTNIRGFNQASIASPFFVLTDLDNYSCPIDLLEDWIKFPRNPNFIFRIAVREIESWILADIDGFSKFIGVSSSNFPNNPDLEVDPKRTLINLVKRSRKRSLKSDIIPINENAKIGPNYNGALMEFVFKEWSVSRAMQKSESLRKAYDYLDRYTYEIPAET